MRFRIVWVVQKRGGQRICGAWAMTATTVGQHRPHNREDRKIQ